MSLFSYSVVHHLASISWEHSPFSLLKSKIVCESLWKSVEEFWTGLCSYLDEVLGKYDGNLFCRKQSWFIWFSFNLEIEWVFFKTERKWSKLYRIRIVFIRVFRKYSALWNLISLFISIINFETKIIIG